MTSILPYDRRAAVSYAHRWAYRRNPLYMDFDGLGGDCTNFTSQCLYAGTGIMNDDPDNGWYYRTPEDRAPAWTGVEFFYHFLTRNVSSQGPFGCVAPDQYLMPGDLIQLRFHQTQFSHTLIVVACGWEPRPDNILVAAHSMDTDHRPLSDYRYQEHRNLHVIGCRPD